jgi:uncharacterized protein (DUF1697 family)
MKSTRYIALLRGINVGGNNIIKMTSLKKVFEECGYGHVTTYIQSGNVIFDADGDSMQTVTDTIERVLSKVFHYKSKVVVLSKDQLNRVLAEVPSEWKNRDDMRRYIAFTREPLSAKDILSEVKLKEGVDTAKTGTGVLYMSTLLGGITKSGFTKLIGTKVYKEITIRNYNTALNILLRME